MSRTITIDPITRLEGHGRIEIFLDDTGAVEDTYFQVPELRGFERFVVGRPIEELPRIVTQICGVCPGCHHLASAKAVDGCFGADVPPVARHLRDLYYQAHFIHSHIAHFFLLAAPDFLCGPEADAATRNVLGVVAKVGPEIGKRVIESRSRAQRIQQLVAGRATHPVWCLPGGVAKGLTEDERDEVRPLGDQLYDFALFSLGLFREAVLGVPAWAEAILRGPYTLALAHMGLVGPRNEVAFYDGEVRVVDCEGQEICRYAPAAYAATIAEHVEPWTYLKFPYLRSRGWQGFTEGHASSLYCAGPLSRLNVADRMATTRAEEAREEMFATIGRKPSGAMLAQHWARLVEMVQAAERIRELVADPEITSEPYRRVPSGITGEGVGIVEAMRGTLTHHYTCDRHGVCTSANLIVGTTNNNAAIHMMTKKVAQSVIRPGVEPTAGILDRIEMAFRAFDPCYSCATHSLPGQMPLRARLHRGGRVWRELAR
jgi:F420-non-reducing hydrogenase large subunit